VQAGNAVKLTHIRGDEGHVPRSRLPGYEQIERADRNGLLAKHRANFAGMPCIFLFEGQNLKSNCGQLRDVLAVRALLKAPK
jgi:hypothetical protein